MLNPKSYDGEDGGVANTPLERGTWGLRKKEKKEQKGGEMGELLTDAEYNIASCNNLPPADVVDDVSSDVLPSYD